METFTKKIFHNKLAKTFTTLRQLQQQIDFLKKNLHAITKAQKTNITDSAKKCGKLANHKLYDCLLNKFNRSLLSQK